MRLNEFDFAGKSSLKILGFSIFLKLDCGSCIVSIAKTFFKKSGTLIRSMKIFSFEVVFFSI